ncbi:MAG: hypothetical protein ACOCP8_02010 [archaeon]
MKIIITCNSNKYYLYEENDDLGNMGEMTLSDLSYETGIDKDLLLSTLIKFYNAKTIKYMLNYGIYFENKRNAKKAKEWVESAMVASKLSENGEPEKYKFTYSNYSNYSPNNYCTYSSNKSNNYSSDYSGGNY